MKDSNRIRLINFKFNYSYKAALASLEKKQTDARLFVNMIDILKAAVLEIEALNVQSNFIKIAFSEKFTENIKEIEQLESSLKERKIIA